MNSSSNNQAMMEDGRTVSLSMIGAAKRGQWLLVQSNLAVDTLTQSEARAMRSAIKEVSRELQSRN